MLPFGYMVQSKIENIIRNRMVEIGCSEMSLSNLSSQHLWQKTGRLNNNELFKLEDARGSRYILAPTHEEEITNLIALNVTSHRSLPLRLFQIGRKFRDELRPRGGLLRGREFTMKDLYSFDETQQQAHDTYREVQQAYKKIFEDLGIPAVVAEADSGSIGGSLSHEYHYLSPSGEDQVLHCPECQYSANLEKAIGYSPEDSPSFTEAQVEYFVTTDHTTLIAAYFAPGRTVNRILLQAEVPEMCDFQGQAAIDAFLSGDEDSMTKSLVCVMDTGVPERINVPDLPFAAHRNNSTTLRDIPIVNAEAGDICSQCEQGTLSVSKAIEVGHTFYLGTKYSEPLNAKITGGNAIEMGCYGIGVTRLVAAIAELTRDSEGFCWPKSICPYDAVVITMDDEGLEISRQLNKVGINAVWDDRDISFGAKLRMARLLGYPLAILLGKKAKEKAMIEVQVRSKPVSESVFVPVDKLEEVKHLLDAV